MISTTFTNFGKVFCCTRKASKDETGENLTIRTKITDDKNVVTNSTLIDCINNTKWNTKREPTQNIDSIGMEITI